MPVKAVYVPASEMPILLRAVKMSGKSLSAFVMGLVKTYVQNVEHLRRQNRKRT